MTEKPIITRVFTSVQQIAATAWDALLALQMTPTPFMRHTCQPWDSGSAVRETGWDAHFITLWHTGPQGEQLVAACPLYLKAHSWGEYVFDMAWARAYHEHGLAYYPKAVVAVPFTPVPGSRLLAASDALRVQLVQAVQDWCGQQLSSAHVLFGDAADHAACNKWAGCRAPACSFTGKTGPRPLHGPSRPACRSGLQPHERPLCRLR
jgi:predicted N-acyltransferase